MQQCLICQENFENKRALATHLQNKHFISTKQYTINFLIKKQPKCLVCNNEPRYVSFTFKKYCKQHSSIAESRAGQIGGKLKKTWNKGLTKNNNKKLDEISKTLTGEKNPFFGKKHTEISKQKMSDSSKITEQDFIERLNKRKSEFEVFTTYKEYEKRQGFYLKMKCKKCNLKQEKTLIAFERGSLCQFCFPNNTSQAEIEIFDFLKNELKIKNIKRNIRSIISPKELDIYLPDYNFAIEYNGLYWHTTDYVSKKHHLEKTLACEEKGIKLFHIFSDEWENKQDIVKSMIAYRLGIIKEKIFARKCKVKQITSKEGKPFFISNHIDGNANASVYFGLYDKNNRLVSCLSIKKPIQKKYGNVCEIARFATLKNTSIVGGLSKLLKYAEIWAKENNFIGILTYANLRFAEKGGYEKVGFTFEKRTPKGYFYTNGIKREFRFKYRAQKPLTEKQVAQNAGVVAIYDCGHNLYLKLF